MKRVLFVAASPEWMTRLNWDREHRDAVIAFERGETREFTAELSPAQRLSDFQHRLDQHKPHIAHFSGHGSDSRQEIVFLDDKEQPVPVDREALANVLSDCEGVVLNACSSVKQAEAIAERGPWAIGMTGRIDNEAAVAFAQTLYLKLADGKAPKDACEGARFRLALDGATKEAADLPMFFEGKSRLEQRKEIIQPKHPLVPKTARAQPTSRMPTPVRQQHLHPNGDFQVMLFLKGRKKKLGESLIEQHIRHKLRRYLQGETVFVHNGDGVLVSGHLKVPPPPGEVLTKQFRYDDHIKEPNFMLRIDLV